MTQHHNDNRHARRRYVVLDIETLNLVEDYERYRRLDPRAAELRFPFKSVCATALLTFEIVEDGLFEFGSMHAAAGDDEAALVADLFNRLRMVGDDAVVTTFGGLNLDMPVLRTAAMRHHLRLPRQLVHNARHFRERLHLDLSAELRAGGQSHVHLSEISTALRLPTKFGDQASNVPKLLAEGKLRRLQDIAMADVINTTMLLQSHLEVHGELTSATAAQIVLLHEVAQRRPEARYADYLRRVERRLSAEAMSAAEAFIASAA